MNPHEKALNSMFDDMDGFESKKMFGAPSDASKGVSITISVMPNGEGSPMEETGEGMNKGGKVGCYSDGGMVEDPDTQSVPDLTLPPFLRKKKKA